jgi:dihydroorotate dehydrogenase
MLLLLFFFSIVFYVEINIQVTEMPHNFSVVQIASTENSVIGVFLTIWGNKVNTFSPVLAKITPDFDKITPLFDLISLFVRFLF